MINRVSDRVTNQVSNRVSMIIEEEEEVPEEQMFGLAKLTKKVQKKQKIRFMGRFKNIELWIPLDVSTQMFYFFLEPLEILSCI